MQTKARLEKGALRKLASDLIKGLRFGHLVRCGFNKVAPQKDVLRSVTSHAVKGLIERLLLVLFP